MTNTALPRARARRIAAALAAAFVFSHTAASAQPAPAASADAYRSVFSTEAIGTRSASIRAGWSLVYRGMLPHAAFAYAITANGRGLWNAVNGRPDEATARAHALAACQRAVARANVKAECVLFAVNGRIVAPGRERTAPGIPAVRQIGPFRASPLHRLHGPAEARGAVIYGHGYGGRDTDARNGSIQGWLSAFNDIGWDILRFDRHPNEDELLRTTIRLQRGVRVARAAGYRQIVLAGQSRGAWQSLRAVADPGTAALVDAVIAIAPAAHGRWDRGNRHSTQIDDWQQLLRALPDDRVRVLTVLFRGDPFDAEIDARLAAVGSIALTRRAPTLALSPSDRVIEGHTAGTHWFFAARYGGSLLAFVIAPEAVTKRGIARAPW
ncbi:MAG: hypothetical protein IT557_09530 [Alphaproteobacteria bacterium]|nr:hypothetical protein [Alphaproteobacteria bacterium]